MLTATVLVTLMLCANAFADEPLPAKIRVLFIGNSYTHTYAIPVQIASLFASQGVTFEHESETPGGGSLATSWSNGLALASIRRGGWDYVVLQDQSAQPLNNRSGVIAQVAQYDAEIRKVGARTLVYQTWPLQSSFTGTSPNLTSANGTYISETYRQAAANVGAILVPVGYGWPAAVNAVGLAAMYLDGSHPSQPGAYLSAITFFRTITRLNTTGLLTKSGISGVSQTQAGQAQAAADGVALAATVAPTFNLATGTYAGAQRITLNTVTPRATIYYSTDGTTPTTSSLATADGGVISITQTSTVKAFAMGAGTSSGITTTTFTITSTNGQTLFGSGSVTNLALAWPGNPTNLAGSNAGFESGAASPWGFYASGGPVDGTIVHTGSFAAQLSVGGMQRYVNVLSSNTLYEARIWYRYGTDVASTAFTAQSFSTPSVQATGVMPNGGLPVSWRQVSRRFTTDATATSVQLICQRNSDTGSYDDLEFYKVPEGYELGLKFRSSIGGRITALRAWRPPGGPTAYTLRLWDAGSTSTPLETVSVTGLSATGWVEVPLPTPRAIVANTNYVVSYGVAEGGFYDAEPNGLQAAITNDALSSVATGNGVYALARGTFPATATGSNYSADVRFVPYTPLQAWRVENFSATVLNNPALEATIWGNLADPDHDGLKNLLEYALQLSPNITNQLPPGFNPTGKPLSLTFLRSRTDVTYIVQAANDLATWTNLDAHTGSAGPPVTVTDTPPLNATRRFVRLKVTSP
ncbi:MAG: DUF4082 domain-containing protein [Luteolibacter sp.]